MSKVFFLIAVTVFGTHLQAGVLTNGSLTVDVGVNGAIKSVQYDGANFFNPGAGMNISDFGIQNGSDEDSFSLNNTYGQMDLALTETGLTYYGSHSWGNVLAAVPDLEYVRSYSLVEGLNALRVTSTITNVSLSSFTITQFDTFDPDQAFGFRAPFNAPGKITRNQFETFNDVIALVGGRVGQASMNVLDINGVRRELTMIVGSLDPREVVASGDPLQLGSGFEVNRFFDNPVDGNNVLKDQGTHIGFRQLLNPNQSTTFTYIMTFGENPNDAQRTFTLASVPEPASLAVFGALGIGGLFLRRRSFRA